MKRLLTILVAFMAILSSCAENIINDLPQTDPDKPSRPEDYGDFVLQDDVKFIAEAYGGYILETIDTTAIIISNDIPEELKPEVGDVIYCMVTPNTPNGFAGRVVSLEPGGGKTKFTTEGVLLTDIFEELHLDMNIAFSEDVTYMIDEEGNKVDCRSVPNEIWKEMDGTEDSADTKAEFDAQVDHTFEIGIYDHDMYEGNVYIGLGTGLSVEITKGKLKKLTFTNTKRCGLIGTMKCEWDNTDEDRHKEKLLDKTIMLPFSIVAGPLILTPDLHIEAGLFFKAEVSLAGDISFELENTRCIFGYENGEPLFKTEKIATAGNRVFALTRFEAKGETGIYAETALEMALYTRKMLALGASAEALFSLSASGEISFGNEELLQINPTITVGPELNTGVYCFSELLKNDGNDTKFGFFMKHELGKFELPLFPKITNFVTEAVNGSFAGKAEIYKDNLVKTEEEGFALFKKEDAKNALAHRQMEITATKASSQGTASFEVSNPDDYILKAYVKADGKYWYMDNRWVDLGLPSGILWAAYNVGADSPEEYGGYYAWGETEEKDSYTWENYKWKGIDIGKIISGTEYDVAHVKWGNGARMPTMEECKELAEICDWKFNHLNEVAGVYVIGPNGNSIFLPEGGVMEGSDLDPTEKSVHLWSGTEYGDWNTGYGLGFTKGYSASWTNDWYNWLGVNIRPVKDKPQKEQ